MKNIPSVAAAYAVMACLLPMSIALAADKDPPLKTAAADSATTQAGGHAPTDQGSRGSKPRDEVKVKAEHPPSTPRLEPPSWAALSACPLDSQGSPRCRASW